MIDKETLARVVEFHGHMCPGLAMGVRAAEVALAEIGPHSTDEEVVAIVETDMCGVDAVQFLTGCTFGKGNFIHRDHGKNAYTFIRRSDGKAIRLSPRPRSFGAPDTDAERATLMAAVRSGTAGPDERARFWEVQRRRSTALLEVPIEELYDVREVDVAMPAMARVMASVDCAACGEPTMETRIRRLDGDELCGPCFDARLAGRSPVSPPTRRPPPDRIEAGSVSPDVSPWPELAFLVPPGEVRDWRMVLLYDAAVDNGLVDALPASAADLAADRGLAAHAVGVVLDGLALWDIVTVVDDGVYAPGPAAPDADATAVLHHHARAIRGWSAITERVRGVPPDPNRMTPGGVEIMLDALAVMGRGSAPDAVDACLAAAAGAGAATVLDLGGGHGQFAAEFARRGLRVVLQDRPEVIDLVRHKGWLDGTGVELFGGDFFETSPDEAFDIVFCAGVVYTMDGERVVRLLRRVRPLIAPGGHLAVHTFLRDTDELATLFSAQMLGGVAGGQSHGEDDLRRWFADAGLRTVATRRLSRRPEWMLFAAPGAT